MSYDSLGHWQRMAAALADDVLAGYLPQKGNAKFMAWVSNGPTEVWMSAKKTIREPEDVKGLIFRTPPSPVYMRAPEALGASPASISAGELYTAYQRGTVDASFSNSKGATLNKWYEVAPYISRILTHPEATFAFVVNLDSWNKLSPDVQKIIMEAAQEAGDWTFTVSAQSNEDYWKGLYEFEKQGVIKEIYVIPDETVKKFVAIVKPYQAAAFSKEYPDIAPGLLDLLDQTKDK
ncbi:TRAP transporter substrate-binding protein, partial [Chloroflexota bacterium]